MKPTKNQVPKHVGLILDGNRRFSKKLMMKPWKGHEFGARKVEKLFDWCKELSIKELTLYAFSLENFYRPKKEFDYLMNLCKKEFKCLLKDKRLDESKIKVRFIGRIQMFDKELQKLMKEVMDKTKNNNNYVVNFAMAYGGRQEVIDAVMKIGDKLKKGKLKLEDINEDVFSKNLYINNGPELIIRTGGEKRTSNFLNFQAAYSEWIFLDIMWPEFEKNNFVECLNEFSRRKRRFGR
ncbi:MAG: di-trans,poly-cis-decaprenylcistransferase [Nanoarchaeota archaeon]|nr:di-trans,poly-cis-decaprenylcistransferase [Nanoarchaeota archaeon]